MPLTLAIDFGSTFTKLVAIDADGEELVGVAQSPTTVSDDVNVGLDRALSLLEERSGVRRADFTTRVASSSAAGGLRMVAIGLVPDLTAEAAQRAALGAGAKVLRVFSFTLTRGDQDALRALAPDIVLLAGGTDGGDRRTIIENARALAALRLPAPVVVAGNRNAADEAASLLSGAGIEATVVANVLPELGRLDVEPARAEIQRIFTERIVQAKGLDRVRTTVGRIVMPTPMAVLQGARLLAEGVADARGLGDVLVVDVGGATTDVHSIATGAPTVQGMIPRGLPEPYAKRTVEGDLGIRINARTILETCGIERLRAAMATPVDRAALERHVERLASTVSHVPTSPWEWDADAALARLAVETAVDRHAGRQETLYTPDGPVPVLVGKDLSAVRTVVGTGGIFAYGRGGGHALGGATFDPKYPLSMRPRAPQALFDRTYMLFAVGLLAERSPRAVLRIFHRHSTPVPLSETSTTS